MKRWRREKWAALLISGSLLPALGNCLPEDYFALSARQFAVALADSFLATVIVDPIFDALNLPDGTNTDADGAGD